MNLEWFRKHKKFVYWFLLPVVGGGMAFFGAMGAFERGGILSGKQHGPSVTYHVGDETHYLNPSQVLNMRAMLAKYSRRRDASSAEVARYLSQYQGALAQGFDVGPDETMELLRKAVKAHTGQDSVTEDIYRRLLHELSMTATQFEQMTREQGVVNKYFGFWGEHIKVDDAEIFTKYCHDKEVVRLRYKEIKSEDFLAKAKAPTDAQIKTYYDGEKKLFERARDKDKDVRALNELLTDLKDVMLTKPTLSADMLFLDTEKLFGGELKPNDDELKKFYDEHKDAYKVENKAATATPPTPAAPAAEVKYKPFEEVKADVESKWKEGEIKNYYDRFKTIYWKLENKPGQPPPAAGDEKVKPFEEVKADAAAKWKTDYENREKSTRAIARMNKMKDDLAEAEKTFAKEQANKPDAKFDLDAWAKKNDLTHWSTKALTEDEFKDGKDEVGSPNAKWVGQMFYLFKKMGYPSYDDANVKRQKEFGYPMTVVKGVVMGRPLVYTPEEVKPMADATNAITERLKTADAIELARKESETLREDWDSGKNLPKIDDLDEVSGDLKSRHPLAVKFFETPKAVGEILPVAEGSADWENPAGKSLNQHFFVGFAVERQPPTWTTFVADSEWDRDHPRQEIGEAHGEYLNKAMSQKAGEAPGGEKDPPLYEEFRKGSSDDY